VPAAGHREVRLTLRRKLLITTRAPFTSSNTSVQGRLSHHNLHTFHTTLILAGKLHTDQLVHDETLPSNTAAKAAMDDKRKGKLHWFFKQILEGKDKILTAPKAKRFLEALCSEHDPVACVESIISSSDGIAAVQQSIRIDVSVSYANTSIAALLQYLQSPDVAAACSGDLLHILLLRMVNPPVFWTYFSNHVEAQALNPVALQSFTWMLLQLLSIPNHDLTPFIELAVKPTIKQVLEDAKQPETRNLFERLQHIVRTLTTSPSNTVDGPGGRHDNDFADFRKIELLPSIDELVSSDPPFLRFASEIEEFEDNERLTTHLDNQFRLLREDMLRDLKEELTGQNKRKGHRIGGLRLIGIGFDDRNQWALEFECSKGLSFLPKQKDHDLRKDFLEKHKKVLSHGSLACVFADGSVVGLGIIWRREDKLAEDVPVLHLHLPGNETTLRRVLKGLRNSTHIEMLQLNTALFAYQPILQQLQNTRYVPLAESIMSWHHPQEIPKVKMPSSLQSLVERLESEPSTELQHLLSLRKPVKLDQSQASSLAVGLSQQIALIQGPPGTGKSFIGALVAKALYQHTKSKILVLSYTNHALDQYLEDLINTGISATNIVRLGSAVKASLVTKPLVLREQTMSKGYKLTRDDWALIDKYKMAASDTGDRLVSAFQEFTQSKAAKKDIMDYLEFSDDFQDYFDAFQLPQEDSFTIVDEKGRAANEFYLLDRWMRNEGASDAIEHTWNYPSVWSTPKDARTTLRKKWLDEILGDRLNRVVDYGQQFNQRIAATSTVRGEGGRRLMKDMRIIGCTTTAAAKYVKDIQSAQPDVIIVEEAGEILESHILAAIGAETKQLVLIGDHKQLRPKAHYDLSVEKGTGYDLNRSLFERLVLKGYPHQKLSQQHRMRPEISALVRGLTYPELTDAHSTKGRAPMRGFRDNVVFVAHSALETEGGQVYDPRDGGSNSSKTNDFEAQMTLKCVKYLAQQGYGSNQIVVLTPYLGQLRLLYDALQTENDPVLNDLDSYDLVRAGLMPQATAKASRTQLRVSTIDNYQGEESDIVVGSLTRSNSRGDIGFLSSPERLNVLISRARDGIVLIGNADTFLNARKGKEIWSEFLGMLREGHHIYDGFPVRCERHSKKESTLTNPGDFDKFCPEGGCDTLCGTMLSCGVHTCPSRCHQLYDHSKMKCTHIVTDTCSVGHKMSWKCWSQRPTVCRTCHDKAKREEERQRKEHQRLVAEALSSQEHNARMAELDAQIEDEMQHMKDLGLRDDRDRAHKQKTIDLQKAKEAAKNAKRNQKVPPAQSVNVDAPNEEVTSSPRSKPDATKGSSAASLHVKDSLAAQDWKGMKAVEGVTNNAIDELMQMTGLETVKAWFVQILQKLQTARRQGTDVKQERLGTVLLGNPGTGKTTVARIYAKFLAEVDAIPGSKFIEATGAQLSNEGVSGTKKMVNDVVEAGGGAIFIDEAYQLVSGNSYGGAAVLDYLLSEIENTTGKVVFMFAGYEKQMEKFFQHNPGLASRMPHRLKFADYCESELLHMLAQKIEKKFQGRMQVEDGFSGLYMRIVVRRLHRMSGQEGFGNARALENVLDRVTSAQSVRLTRERRAGLQPDDFLLCKQDLIGPEPSGALLQSVAWAKLQKMIGLDSVKAAVQTLLDRLTQNYARELKEKPPIEVSLNRLFLGSPGTGKTTVAKLYGQILAEIGILSTSECVLKTPSDFIGSVMGESEKNTKAIIENTKGKVLVLDEAYMLYSSSSAGDPYRTAVVDTIVSEVHSVPGDDRAVLLLGYEDQMKEMLRKVNPGLTRRFPIENAFFFEDYNDEQLLSILNLKLASQGLAASDEAKDTAVDVLAKLRRRPNFGNAGEVENLLSRAKDSHSKRQKLPAAGSIDEIVFEPQDFDPEFGRSGNALDDCKALFKDVVGSGEVVEKLTGYIQSFNNARELGWDPTEIIPFNFVFKGPPGMMYLHVIGVS